MSIFFLLQKIDNANFPKWCYAFWFLWVFKLHLPPKFLYWFVAWRPQSNSMELWQINRLKSNRFSFLHQNPDCTKVATTDFDTVSTCSSNMIFCVATGLDSAIKISIKIPTIVEEDSIESFFNSWNKILELWKRTEVSLFQSPRLWKPGFSVSWGLIFSIMISFRSFWLLAKLQVEKLSRFFLATETWWSENSQRCYYFSFNSMFKLNFIQIYIFDLFHHDPNLSVWSFDKSVE